MDDLKPTVFVCTDCGYVSTNPSEFATFTASAVDGVFEGVCRACTPTVEIVCTHGSPTFAVCPVCTRR